MNKKIIRLQNEEGKKFVDRLRQRPSVTSLPLLHSYCQGYGVDTQISGSGSSSGHLILLAPAPEQFGPKNIALFV